MLTDPYPQRTDWTTSEGKINISCLVFNDLNRNGRYDHTDRLMAGVIVRSENEDSEPVLTKSNLAGFANFAMSSTHADAIIKKSGARQFEVVPPPGWHVTTDNQIQTATFVELPGSPSGLICLTPPTPVGLAQERTISGYISQEYQRSEDSLKTHKIMLFRNHERIAEIKPDEASGYFCSPPIREEGDYILACGERSHPIHIRHTPVNIGRLTSSHSSTGTDRQEKHLHFDTATSFRISKVGNDLHGLDWHNFVITEKTFYGGEGYCNGCISGANVLYNGSGHPAEFSHPDGFDFISCQLTNPWPQADGQTVTIQTYRGTELLAEDQVTPSHLGPITYQPRIPNVTRVRFSTDHYWQFVFDDLCIAR